MRLIKMNIIRALRNNVFTRANTTPRRHCEAKEKIQVREKIHLPKQSHSQLNNERLLRRYEINQKNKHYSSSSQ